MEIFPAFVWQARAQAALTAGLQSMGIVRYLRTLDLRLDWKWSPPPSAVFVSVHDEAGEPTAGAAAVLMRRLGHRAILGVLLPTSAEIREMRASRSAIFSEFVIIGIDDPAVTLGGLLCAARAAERIPALDQARYCVPTRALDLFAQCASVATRGPHSRTPADEVAFSLGFSRRTLGRQMRHLELPPPAVFIRWLRLISSADQLREAHRTVQETSEELGFLSADDYRRVLRRMAGLRPSDLRSSDGVRRLLDSFTRMLDAYRRNYGGGMAPIEAPGPPPSTRRRA
jgi:AraC-like DNA-binding protein